MAHCVQAFVGQRAVLERIHHRFLASRVADLARDLSILPLDDKLFDAVPETEADDAWPSNDRFEFLRPKIGRLLVETSRESGAAIAYVETDYFGGAGTQAAIVVRDGAVVFGPAIEGNAINGALRILGVRTVSAHDEFDEVGLGRFRSNESWIARAHIDRA